MASPRNHWKLGLFVVGGLALALGTVAVLGARSMQREVGLYVSYFDESVQGLEVGSPIKFRGVTVGTVKQIRVAADHRHVEVESALGVDELARLGLDVGPAPLPFGAPRKLQMAPDLRLQLASAGLTGVKFLQLDFFEVASTPPPALPFPVPENYIPTVPSMIKNLENSLSLVVSHLPEITRQTSVILGEIERLLREIAAFRIGERVSTTLDGIDALVGTTRHELRAANAAGLSKDARQTLAAIEVSARRLDALFARLERDDGLIGRAERASSALGDTLRDADGLGPQLFETLQSIDASARSLRRLTDALEVEPDMLVKGRSEETLR